MTCGLRDTARHFKKQRRGVWEAVAGPGRRAEGRRAEGRRAGGQEQGAGRWYEKRKKRGGQGYAQARQPILQLAAAGREPCLASQGAVGAVAGRCGRGPGRLDQSLASGTGARSRAGSGLRRCWLAGWLAWPGWLLAGLAAHPRPPLRPARPPQQRPSAQREGASPPILDSREIEQGRWARAGGGGAGDVVIAEP